MSGWDALTGNWDPHEGSEGPGESEEQGYQQGSSYRQRSYEQTLSLIHISEPTRP